MNSVSVIVIGLNVERTLENCLKSIQVALANAQQLISTSEIIYVDSNSTDQSCRIAEAAGAAIVRITDGFTSPALGRNLGLGRAKHDVIFFVDGDMEIHPDWLLKALPELQSSAGVIGERHELVYSNSGKLRYEVEQFEKLKEKGPVKRLGGFLLVNKSALQNLEYDYTLIDEEEADLYAKLRGSMTIHALPIPAYKHHNYNYRLVDRVMRFIHPFINIGYVLSLFKSIKGGYFGHYAKLQTKYLVVLLASCLFYGGLMFGSVICVLLAFVLCFWNTGLSFLSNIANVVSAPYKIITAIIYSFWSKDYTVAE